MKWKEALKKKWDASGNEEDREEYKEAKQEAWQVMAIAKTRAWDNVYAKLGTQEGEEKIFRIAKACNKATKDLNQIKQMKDQEGSVLTDENQIRERWKVYFETLLNENPRMGTGDGTPNQGMTTEVPRTGVEKELRKMKNGKSPGPDEIPVKA